MTTGGQQSNHCRATACAARTLGLQPHLILRTNADSLGLTGNLLLDHMVGTNIYTCTTREYGRIGSDALVQQLCCHLQDVEGNKAYGIPLGGSNAIGTWGYVEAVDELKLPLDGADSRIRLDHAVFACGRGVTAAAISIGLALCPMLQPHVHNVTVCDDPDYFYGPVTQVADEMGFRNDRLGQSTADFVKKSMTVHQGKGQGYALSKIGRAHV